MIGADDPVQPKVRLDKLGRWPEGTWLQQRQAEIKLAELKVKMKSLKCKKGENDEQKG